MITQVRCTQGSGRKSFVLHETGNRYHWEGVGLLSIKAFFNSVALYDTGLGQYKVDPNCYLILNEGQRYSITIDSDQKAESFCIFLEPGLIEEALRSANSSAVELLDRPHKKAENVCFFERTYPHDDRVTPILVRIRSRLKAEKGDPSWLEEQFHCIATELLKTQKIAREQMQSLSSFRSSTREELYRRLYRAVDFAMATMSRNVSLNEMARAACLSTNHFIRTFRELFGQTPHQFLTTKRLESACALLENSDQPVTDICYSVGFESLGSFSSLFRRRIGVAPQEYRRTKR